VTDEPGSWLLLAFQIPPRAASLRVRVWRRLQAVGAVAVGTALYALPDRPACREDFEWLLRAIREGGGDGAIVAGQLRAGLDDAALRARFEAEREAEYRELAKTLRELARSPRKADGADDSQGLARARRRMAEIEARDHFGADGAAVAAGLLRRLAADAAGPKPREKGMQAKTRRAAPRGKTWVTRERVHVDRIACAWLIRRFIDPEARFRFVVGRSHRPGPDELRYDMFEAEYTHDADRCSFETLLAAFALRDPALRALGEIVHDIDLKDARYGRPETAGVAAVLQGLCRDGVDDPTRLRRGGELFDDLYLRFGGAAA
jgi:hypothetical protein